MTDPAVSPEGRPRRRRRLVLLLLGAAAAGLLGTGVALVATSAPDDRGTVSTRPGGGDDVVVDGAVPDLGQLPDLRPPDHDKARAVWMVRHGALATAPNASCSVCHPSKRCLTCHKTQVPHPAGWSKAHGKAVLATGRQACLTCHQDGPKRSATALVSLGDKLNCRSCHVVTMPHAATWVASGHRIAARASTGVCATCHTRATCETCHSSTQVSSCRACHAAKVIAIARPAGHATSQCLTCHKTNPNVIGPGPGHRTVPLCLRCHTSTRLGRPVTLQSERDWTTSNGLGYTAWNKRGAHAATDLVSCKRCHAVHDAKAVTFPLGVDPKSKSCATSCHSWLKGTVVSRGFLNASGDPEATTYRGPITPEFLLATGSTKHTTVVYAETGCAGRCHQGPHGTVTMCITCHNYKWNSPDNLHGTHVSLVTAEQRAADPGDADGQAVCRYCHKPGTNGVREGETLWRRACYSCHLSGHNPIVPYWKAG